MDKEFGSNDDVIYLIDYRTIVIEFTATSIMAGYSHFDAIPSVNQYIGSAGDGEPVLSISKHCEVTTLCKHHIHFSVVISVK